MEAKESITPDAWAACVRHVVDQEKYFMEMDSKLEILDEEEWEDVEEGTVEEVLANEVAHIQYQNPSSSSKTYSDLNLNNTFSNNEIKTILKIQLEFGL